MILTAITGSIGCGKTTIATLLREQGFLVLDIDRWVKHIYFDKNFLKIIHSYFPECFENGVFNKRLLRGIVFNDKNKLRLLESLIHPFLKKKLKKFIRRNSKNQDIVFVDVALLYEMGWEKFFDYVILADVDYKIQKERVMVRDNITEAEFDRINDIQMPQKEKYEKVDFIVNTGVSKKKILCELIEIIEGLF